MGGELGASNAPFYNCDKKRTPQHFDDRKNDTSVILTIGRKQRACHFDGREKTTGQSFRRLGENNRPVISTVVRKQQACHFDGREKTTGLSFRR
jgi:hypothetical protein